MSNSEEAQQILNNIIDKMQALRESVVGWTKIDYPRGYTSMQDAIDIELWAEQNCGDFIKSGRTFWFKNENDATLFLLRFA